MVTTTYKQYTMLIVCAVMIFCVRVECLISINWLNPGYICVHVPSQGLDSERDMSSSFLVFSTDKR